MESPKPRSQPPPAAGLPRSSPSRGEPAPLLPPATQSLPTLSPRLVFGSLPDAQVCHQQSQSPLMEEALPLLFIIIIIIII